MDKLKLKELQKTIENEKKFNISKCEIQLFDPTTIFVTIDKIEDTTVEKEFINYFINLSLKNNLVIYTKKMVNEKFSNEEMATYAFNLSE